MTTSMPTDISGDAPPVRPLPLVHRAFGEPRFPTDADVAALAFAADGTLWSIDEAGLLRHWSPEGKPLARHFLSDLEMLWCFSPGAALLASGNDDLILWDVLTGQLVNRIAQPSWVTAVAVDATRRTLARWGDARAGRLSDAAPPPFLRQA